VLRDLQADIGTNVAAQLQFAAKGKNGGLFSFVAAADYFLTILNFRQILFHNDL
jgi:hypothetical protein